MLLSRFLARPGIRTVCWSCVSSTSQARHITTTGCKLTDSRDTKSRPSDSDSESKTPPTPISSKQDSAKSVTQADQELRERMEQMSGDGGAAGIEYEDGKPAAMKRSVRNNMFRYI
ncbi:hypothetical protein BO70DRAFT_159357 [Aspergillus heteromorphus CBS 117.55]|uniref:Uncharacterized protein n=1 Tax=Aspergillus heteromorphus CBS 117.55 TaxID=1448321 RepID=A0A317WRF5_9EURO|nr:uncharacterized protein BO70DRAFT_159357 [Aspergillus heteromorphus CBS 117.55]PWY89034.1 hypothetical protein BO70DRAFT_159357 [Aspergillus heteromorphus CBS 117.55]